MAKIFTRGGINDLGPITSFTTKTNKCVTFGELINLNAPANIVINSAGVGVETTKTVPDDGSNEKVFDKTTINVNVPVTIPRVLNGSYSLYCTVELIEFNGAYTFPVSTLIPNNANNYASKKLTDLMSSTNVELGVGGQTPGTSRPHTITLSGWIPKRHFITPTTHIIYQTNGTTKTVNCNCTAKLRFTFSNLPDLETTKLEVVIGSTIINGHGKTEYEYIYSISNRQQMLNFYDGKITLDVNYYDVS
jgi:hypothetical protein